MAPRIIAFSSTPRSRGNSDILADHILAGAAEAGAATEKVRLHSLTIRPCTACDACQVRIDAPCVLKDDVQPLLDAIRQADGLVFASPIYFCCVNGPMKTFLDRLYALFGEGRFDALRGKRMAVALTYGVPDPFASGTMVALRMFQDAARGLEMDLTGWVSACCMGPGEVEKQGPVLAAARALGRKLMVGAPSGH